MTHHLDVEGGWVFEGYRGVYVIAVHMGFEDVEIGYIECTVAIEDV